MELIKTTLTIDGNELTIGVPFMKVNAEKRTVEGFATLDNEDKMGDIVDYDASLKAFNEWPGNIREMHQKVAVGKALIVEPRSYTDEDGNEYDGIWVKAKISKGAQDTWEKIMDGTLTGFSIGGAIQEKKQILSKNSGRSVNLITKYRLNELSVVDNPCNGLAAITLVKDITGTDTLADGELEIQIPDSVEGVEKMQDNIKDDLQKGEESMDMAMGSHDPASCGDTGVGHLGKAASHMDAYASHAAASGDPHSAADAHRAVANIADMSKQARYNAAINATEGPVTKGVDMDETTTELHNNSNSDNSVLTALTSDDINKFVEFAKSLNSDQQQETTVSTEAPAEELTKGDDITDMNEETLTKALTEMTENISKMLSTKVDEVSTTLEEVSKRFDTVATSEAVDELKKSLEEVTGRVSTLENSGAIQKSNESAGAEKLEKSAGNEGLWSDSIVPSILKDRFGGLK